jgi:Right handed beta helix region
VDSSQELTIKEGVKIYFANNSGLWVYRGGRLKVEGTQAEPVLFQGIRRESYYQDIAGQWDRIWINEGSTGNMINYAEIRNGFIGIQAESLLDTLDPKNLLIKNTIIHNMSGFGVFTRYYNLQVRNTVITRCGQYAVALTQGGEYEFTHCTIANYWNDSQRSTPSLYMNDYAQDETGSYYEFPLGQADFRNCIIWGSNDEELEIDYHFNSDNHNFRNVLLKSEIDTNTVNFSNILLNVDPFFVDYSADDYQLLQTSPARDYGDPLWATGDVAVDIKGKDRTVSPDLGAYEYE